jgi:hypothetical protein
MSERAKECNNRPEVKNRRSEVAKKRFEDPKEREIISEKLKNRVFTQEHKNNLSSSERGEKNHEWKGGISFEPYCVKFTREFKERVRAFFGHTCAECGISEEANGKKLPVHHVTYNKKVCCDGTVPLFVPLCNTCHSKTNHNRIFWEYWFTEMINRFYGGKCYFTKEEMEVYGKI